MARTETIAAAATQPRLPDPASFRREDVLQSVADDGPSPGTVIGLDRGQWASAIVDLDSKPERISAARGRLQRSGYQKAEGFEVAGFRNPEVWVLPRALYEDLRKARRQRLRDRVLQGSLSDQALVRPKVTYQAPNGAEVPVDF